MIRPSKIISWFSRAKPMREIVPIARFVDDHVFATKNGAYGSLLKLRGVDDEGVTDQYLASVSARLDATFKLFGEDIRVYQYFVKRTGYTIPCAESYQNPTVQEIVNDRIAHLDKTAQFGRFDLYLCILSEATIKGKVKPRRLRREMRRGLFALRSTTRSFLTQVADLFTPELLAKEDVFWFFRSLLNPDARVADAVPLRSDKPVDEQLVSSPLVWNNDHLKIGTRFVNMFALKDLPKGTAPNLFSELLKLNCDMVLCSEWQRKGNPETRSAVLNTKKFLEGFKKYSLLSLAAHYGSSAKIENSIHDESAEEIKKDLGQVLVEIEQKGGHFGHFSMIGMVHSEDQAAVMEVMPRLHRIFGEHDASIIEETVGGLSAYFAILPGNSKFNVRRQWLQNNHYSNLSFVYAPFVGETYSDSLDNEYLVVYETRTGSPFFFDPYYNGLRGLLIVGAPRAGKSMNGNFMVAGDQKYGGYTYIFDIGGSYESTIQQFGGRMVRIGLDGPRINPFSLLPTDENLQFLAGFIKLLLTKAGAPLSPIDERDIFAKVRRMYSLDPQVRRLRHLILAPHLQPYLGKWIGQYGAIFDNAVDELDLVRVQGFDFQDIGEDHQDLLEPLLFWLIRRTNSIVHDPANLGVPKHLLFDEVWKHLKNPALVDLILTSLKTGGKHLAGVTLLTHLADDLGQHTSLITNACPMTMFLPDPSFDRAQYRELFGLNEKELANLSSLRPREAMLKTPEYSKVVLLNLDPKSYWRFTTAPRDRVKRAKALAEHGEHAFEVLAASGGHGF